jgi:hypothetical protein
MAETEFTAAVTANPNSDQAARLLTEIQTLRGK